MRAGNIVNKKSENYVPKENNIISSYTQKCIKKLRFWSWRIRYTVQRLLGKYSKIDKQEIKEIKCTKDIDSELLGKMAPLYAKQRKPKILKQIKSKQKLYTWKNPLAIETKSNDNEHTEVFVPIDKIKHGFALLPFALDTMGENKFSRIVFPRKQGIDGGWSINLLNEPSNIIVQKHWPRLLLLRKSKNTPTIIRALLNANTAVGLSDIEKITGINRGIVSKTLKRLVDKLGLVERTQGLTYKPIEEHKVLLNAIII